MSDLPAALSVVPPMSVLPSRDRCGVAPASAAPLSPSLPDPARSRLPNLVLTGVAVAVVAVGLGLRYFPVRPGDAANPVGARAEVVAAADAVDQVSDQFWTSVVPEAVTRLQDNALQSEINSVYDSARSALDFLALNFLPTGAGVTAPKGTEGRAKG